MLRSTGTREGLGATVASASGDGEQDAVQDDDPNPPVTGKHQEKW